MGLVKTVQVAARIHKLERSRGMRIKQQLEALSDPTLLNRMAQPVIVITVSRQQVLRAVYSKNRNIIQ